MSFPPPCGEGSSAGIYLAFSLGIVPLVAGDFVLGAPHFQVPHLPMGGDDNLRHCID